MNAEADTWIAQKLQKLLTDGGIFHTDIEPLIVEAMRWAYADAARVCRERSNDAAPNVDGFYRAGAFDCAEAIEGRARHE